MKKKLICLALIAAVVLSLAGCAGKRGPLDPNDPVTVTVWHYYNGVQQTRFDEMVSEFNATVGAERGVIVVANSKNSVGDLANSIIASVNNEPGADIPPVIFATYAETAWKLRRDDKLVDLAKYLTKDELAEYVPAYLDEGALGEKGKLYIFPTAKSTEVLMLNVTDWEKFASAVGVTENDFATWESLAEVARKYYEYTDAATPDVPNDGRAFFGRDSVANYMVVGARELGHPFASVASDGSVTVEEDKDTLKALWNNFYVPFVKGYYAAESRFRSDDAKTGEIIALIGSTTSAAYYPTEVTIDDEYTYPIENAVFPVPHFAGMAPCIVQQGAGMSVLKSDEKTEYAAALFLKWITDVDRNLLFAAGSGYLPVKSAANDYAAFAEKREELGVNDTTLRTFKVAAEEINSCTLYTSPPYDRSAEVRDFVEHYMSDTAASAKAEARSRIADGESPEAVWAEYTGDAAFEQWYASFVGGLKELIQ